MSYEGYTQRLCKNGHYFESDANLHWYSEEEQKEMTTCDCGSDTAWTNEVDETNEAGQGLIKMESFRILSEDEHGTQYDILSKEESKTLRTYERYSSRV
jgi:hypothetical protein